MNTPLAMASAGLAGRHGAPSNSMEPRAIGAEPKQSAQQAALARAERAGHRDDFAGMNFKVKARRARDQADTRQAEE
jgi:hypothetical protein